MTRRLTRASGELPERARLEALVEQWWDTVVAGEADEPHPVYGDRVVARLRDGRLKVSGEVDSKPDRDELVSQASERAGRGLSEVDTAGLRIAQRNENAGVLDQTMVAAFPSLETAEVALKLILERSQIQPKTKVILPPHDTRLFKRMAPGDFAADVRKHLDLGRAVLILRVDETEVFKLRALVEEDTRSLWTIATPPQLAG
ncbi:MAG: hypothetical protein ACREOM_11080 [Candidatus Dormibacteraceae bacterium]